MAEALLTVKEAARIAGVTWQSVYQALHEGRLKAARQRPWLIRREDLDEWIAQRKQK